MKIKVNLKDKEIKELLKYMFIIVDSREDEDKPIIQYFKKKKIPFKRKKLDFGDYSFGISKNPIFEELGIKTDVSFENQIAIECKMSLDEISNNLTKERERFNNEFMRAKFKNCEMHLLIENATLDDIYNRSYNSQFNEKSFINSLISFQLRYDLKIHFIRSDLSGYHILQIFKIYLKHFLEE